MKIDLVNTTVTESNVLDIEEVEMKFSESALPHLTRMFVNLYNNPDEAVYREILFNAIDATKKSGSVENIEVYLPTRDTPVLTMVDKGVGMSLEDLKRNSQFGGTDKNDENDSVGGFGLGFKSPLSITSQFSVESIKDGERTVVTISNSEDGICRMSVLLREEADLPNGTTVSVPVKNVTLMREVAEKYTMYVPQIVSYFNRNDYYPVFQEETHYTSFTEVFEGFYDPKEYYGQELVIVMGGVPYTVSYKDLYFHVPELRGLFQSKYILEAPIGSISLSPNREGVQFNQATKDTIKELLFDKLKDYIDEFKKTLNESETYLEAYNKYRNSNMGYFIPSEKAEWNGVGLQFNSVYLGVWEREDEVSDLKFKKKVNYFLTEVSENKTTNSITSIRITDKKLLFVEPHEDIKNSRSTYLIRQYFKKNDLSFDDVYVYRTNFPLDEYTTYNKIDVLSVNENGDNLFSETLELLKQDFEVLSIHDIKEDLADWKAPKKAGTGTKPKVKYLDRMVDFLFDNGGVLAYDSKSLSDIIGDGNKKLGVYEYRSGKDEYVSMTHFDTEVFNKFVLDKFGVSELDGVIILRNNAKPEILTKNTEKFDNEYVLIEDFYSITEFHKIDRAKEIFSGDIKPISFLETWRYGYILEMDSNTGEIKDDMIREILDKGSVDVDPDDMSFLTRIRVSDSKVMADTAKKFVVDVVGLSDEEAENLFERYSYQSLNSVISDSLDTVFRRIINTRYSLVSKENKKASLEYMNLMFDHKYSK